ncbi:MAG: hypothetical protein A3J28_06585 [Acidobacteria bacterium RIFCSPLOWO2_12_FULL_60_22]|nr:MAG: hypothetical protein A3J28_06585 [Acidobacteria bacterium RIFCSPLOWO2_12_FULL_60_22]
MAHAAAPQHFLYFLPLPQGQGSFLENLPSSLVNFVSAANAMNNDSLVFRLGFVNDPPVASTQFEESFPVPAERQRGNLIEVIHKPLDPFHNPLLDRRIKLCQIILSLWSNQKPPACHANSVLILFENLGKVPQLPFLFRLQRLLKPEDCFPAQG